MNERARDPHFLEGAKGRTCQDSERKRKSERNSLPRERKGRDKSGQKESVRVRSTHILESAGGTSKGIEGKRGDEGHSRSGECKGRDNSKWGKKARVRATLTY
jgi:hypothetical protein